MGDAGWSPPVALVGAVLLEEGQRKPEPEGSLLLEGLDWSRDRVAYASLGDSSPSEGEAGGGRWRNWLRGDAGERGGGGV